MMTHHSYNQVCALYFEIQPVDLILLKLQLILEMFLLGVVIVEICVEEFNFFVQISIHHLIIINKKLSKRGLACLI
jgi:hypothetical protein